MPDNQSFQGIYERCGALFSTAFGAEMAA